MKTYNFTVANNEHVYVVEEVEDNTEVVVNAIQSAVLGALESCGLLATSYAKASCPVRTGRLRSSITEETSASENRVYIGTDVEYANYVECGTSKQKEQPYLRPALNKHESQYRTIFANALKNAEG